MTLSAEQREDLMKAAEILKENLPRLDVQKSKDLCKRLAAYFDCEVNVKKSRDGETFFVEFASPEGYIIDVGTLALDEDTAWIGVFASLVYKDTFRMETEGKMIGAHSIEELQLKLSIAGF